LQCKNGENLATCAKNLLCQPAPQLPGLSHLEDAVAALGVKLSPEEIAALEAPYVPHPVLGFI
jgi:hypothetical protein